MKLSQSLQEAMTYYFLRDGDKSVGGPYSNIAKLAAGLKRFKSRKGPKASATVRPMRIVGGAWLPLTPDEAEALVAATDG